MPLIDALQRALWLLDHDRGQIGVMLQAAQVHLARLQTLAQALESQTLGGAAKTEEQQACDRLLAQFRRVVESRVQLLL